MKKRIVSFVITALVLLLLVFWVKSCESTEPITFELNTFGDFFANFIDNFILFPLAYLVNLVSTTLEGKYIFGVLAVSLPVLLLSNLIHVKNAKDTMAMRVASEEIDRIKEKYANVTDMDEETVKQRINMESMHIYRKYGVKPFSFLFAFVNIPVLIALYLLFTRFPHTDALSAGLDHTLWGLDLYANAFSSPKQLFYMIGIVLLIIVFKAIAPAVKEKGNGSARPLLDQTAAMELAMLTLIFVSNASFAVYHLVSEIFFCVIAIIEKKKIR